MTLVGECSRKNKKNRKDIPSPTPLNILGPLFALDGDYPNLKHMPLSYTLDWGSTKPQDLSYASVL